MNIIAKLNTLKTLTPDQIVARLSCNGWKKFTELTAEQYAPYHRNDVQCRLVHWNHSSRYWVDDGVHGLGSWAFDRTRPGALLEIYWFKPSCDYQGREDNPGDPTSRYPERERSSYSRRDRS